MSSLYETQFDQVSRLYTVLLDLPPTKPHMLNIDDQRRRLVHILEEVDELKESFVDCDLVGAADALVDLVYVAMGTAYEMGLPFDELWRIVHHANMSKRRGMSKRGFAFDLVKPEGWVDPKVKIKEVLDALILKA